MKNNIENKKCVMINYRLINVLWKLEDYGYVDDVVYLEDRIVIRYSNYTREIILEFESKFNRIHKQDYVIIYENNYYNSNLINSELWDINEVDELINSIHNSIGY